MAGRTVGLLVVVGGREGSPGLAVGVFLVRSRRRRLGGQAGPAGARRRG